VGRAPLTVLLPPFTATLPPLATPFSASASRAYIASIAAHRAGRESSSSAGSRGRSSFPTYDFIPATAKGIVADLIIKHVLMIAGVIAGAFMWVRMGRLAREYSAGNGQ
jgi:hypothetical protein